MLTRGNPHEYKTIPSDDSAPMPHQRHFVSRESNKYTESINGRLPHKKDILQPIVLLLDQKWWANSAGVHRPRARRPYDAGLQDTATRHTAVQGSQVGCIVHYNKPGS